MLRLIKNRKPLSHHFEKFVSSFKKKKFELLFDFIAMVIGIVIGFECENINQNHRLNNSTKIKLHYLYLESEYNTTMGKRLYDAYTNIDSLVVYLNYLDDSAARTAFEDVALSRVIPHYKISLIRSYLDAIYSVNNMNEKYINYLDVVNYKKTSNGIRLRMKLRDNVAGFLATCYETQQQLKEFYNDNLYDKSKINEIEKRIKEIKVKVLNNQFKLEKELSQ